MKLLCFLPFSPGKLQLLCPRLLHLRLRETHTCLWQLYNGTHSLFSPGKLGERIYTPQLPRLTMLSSPSISASGPEPGLRTTIA